MQIDFERLPNLERVHLFPFLRQKRTLSLAGNIPHLKLRLDKKSYNLLNKCLIYNLTYDDEKEHFFQHNFRHQRLMEFSDMSNIIKIGMLEVEPVELNQLLRLADFEFWFMRDLLMAKRMHVKAKHLALSENRESLVTGDRLEDPLQYQLDFCFES
jgi:hypothetical protein